MEDRGVAFTVMSNLFPLLYVKNWITYPDLGMHASLLTLKSPSKMTQLTLLNVSFPLQERFPEPLILFWLFTRLVLNKYFYPVVRHPWLSMAVRWLPQVCLNSPKTHFSFSLRSLKQCPTQPVFQWSLYNHCFNSWVVSNLGSSHSLGTRKPWRSLRVCR